MILYLIRFSLALALIYGFYRVFLEREKAYSFNRYYLLAGIIISLAIPLIPIGGSEPVKYYINQAEPRIEGSIIQWESLIVYTYWLITAILGMRFSFDIFTLIKKIKKSEHRLYGKAHVVLLEEPTSPYSFLQYVFISKEHFNDIEPELLEHELAHIRQLHTFDILLIELVKILVWVNPMLNWYKKSMQLNHEFLADHQVIISSQNVESYQNILLSYIGLPQPAKITSSFSFALTKKRFRMMTKRKSKTQILKQAFVVPLLGLIILACSDNAGVNGKEMLLYWRYTANMEEILQTGAMNEVDLSEGIILPIENKEQYDELVNIYNRMNQSQKESVYKLPPYLEPISE